MLSFHVNNLICVCYFLSLRLGALLVLSIVLISPVAATIQGIIAVLAVLIFVFGFALGLGAGISTVKLCSVT